MKSDFQNMEQEEGETMQKFISRIHEMGIRAYRNDKTIRDDVSCTRLIEGVRDRRIRNKLLDKPNQSLEDLIKEANKYDKILRSNKARRTVVTDGYDQEVYALANTNPTQESPTPNGPGNTVQFDPNPQIIPPQTNTTPPQPSTVNHYGNTSIVCYTCGQPGHFSRGCASTPRNPRGRYRGGRSNLGNTASNRTFNRANTQCWDCQQFGHTYRNCPTPRGGTAQHNNNSAPQSISATAPASNITDGRPASNMGRRVPQNLMASLNGSPAAVNLINSGRVQDL